MARTARSYTMVTLENGVIATYEYANADALRDALAKYEGEDEPRIFVGEEVAFTIDRTPRVVLGEKTERKPRAKKAAKAKATKVGADFFETKSTNGTNAEHKE